MPETSKLFDSKEPCATVFKLAPIPMSISTLVDGTYIDVNEALLAATGYARDEIVGRTARELQVYEDPNDFIRMRDLLSAGQGIRLEVRLRTKDGRARANLVTADIIDIEGEKCLLTASLDIEDRRQNEYELQFLDDLGQRVMPLSDANEILRSITTAVGERFAVSVCAYADMEPDQDHFTIRDNWHARGAPSIVGHYSLATFGERAVSSLRAGQPLVLCDIAQELPAHEAKTYSDIGLAATICMPLVKNGRLTALMAIHDHIPRLWSEREKSLFRDVTERCWAHIERVRLIEQLKESEARYRGAVITGKIAAWETDMVTRSRNWTE